jgi:hypothetical protein
VDFRSIVVTLSVLVCASTTRAGTQLFEGSWSVKAFGNACSTWDPTPGPYCGGGASESRSYSAFGIPQGIQCNPYQPRCPFESTPSDGSGSFAPLGGHRDVALYCTPWSNWGAMARPAKGGTQTTGGKHQRLIPPLYRNPAFFTSGGLPRTTICTGYSSSGSSSSSSSPGYFWEIYGDPLTGTHRAVTTGTGRGGFSFLAAGTSGSGIRGSRIGEFGVYYPYVYSYTYADLRNGPGVFGPGKGPGSFSLPYKQGANTVARVIVKQGAAKFGGTMRMLGQLTTKSCYYRNGGCSMSYPNWRFDAVGAAAYTSGGVVTKGYIATFGGQTCLYCSECTCPDTGLVSGSRFPWTTGSATVTAVGRGPHKTVHYAKGYDNRTPTSGAGTVQLVSPVLTRWLEPGVNFETGGIGILRIKFAPEPRAWVVLIAGVSCLAVIYRWRSA